ncbi:hypothetical protein CP973_01510 [Streptomyces albofaciens JCM 4342]|uniref:hypothetical protein n=1 Tax=Streptomyces albofaciens TaxID=66866 RepID=UPI000AA4FFB5|nr:hypothetical protein [Streptomyces albofaciens]KAA6220836.1 hypothetical protein CP973_01510 [Streptomyces albofaciens JCM 4342]
MRSKWVRRISVAASGAVAAGVLPLVVASPAQAWSADCQKYLRQKGYSVPTGGEAAKACSIAEDGEGSAYSLDICRTRLESLHVKNKHSVPACKKGAAR